MIYRFFGFLLRPSMVLVLLGYWYLRWLLVADTLSFAAVVLLVCVYLSPK